MKKLGFEEEFSWLEKLGILTEYLPLFIRKVREMFRGRKREFCSGNGEARR